MKYSPAVTFLLVITPLVQAAEQRIELDQMSIIGSQEAPSIHYVVPWVEERSRDLSLLDLDMPNNDGLALDRSELQRSVLWHSESSSAADKNKSNSVK